MRPKRYSPQEAARILAELQNVPDDVSDAEDSADTAEEESDESFHASEDLDTEDEEQVDSGECVRGSFLFRTY